jgi:TRAP-type transport system small permease protein
MEIEKTDNEDLNNFPPSRRFSIEEIIGVFLMIAISLTMGIGVFFRYVLNDSLSWTEEVSRYGLVYVTFIGCSLAVRKGSHIRIDFIDLILPSRARKASKIANDVICLLFFIYMGYKAFQIIGILHTTKSTALQVPMSYVYIVIFIGFIFSAIRLISSYLFKYKQMRAK